MQGGPLQRKLPRSSRYVSPRAELEVVVAIPATPAGPIVGFVPMAPVVAGSIAAAAGLVVAARDGSIAAAMDIVVADSIPVAEIVASVSPLSCKM